MKKQKEVGPVSPGKSVLDALQGFRATFRATVTAYATRLEQEIEEVQTAVATLVGAGRPGPGRAGTVGTEGAVSGKTGALASPDDAQFAPERLRDLRDMLTLLRTLEVRPEKGRRKDLKKMDLLVDDLRLLAQGWDRGLAAAREDVVKTRRPAGKNQPGEEHDNEI